MNKTNLYIVDSTIQFYLMQFTLYQDYGKRIRIRYETLFIVSSIK